ncbi:hypothetical protein N321_04584, partial [Antrostomus carolinensis]
HGRKMWQGRVRLAMRKRFLRQRVVEHWNRLPREVLMAPSLTRFQQHLAKALRDMV